MIKKILFITALLLLSLFATGCVSEEKLLGCWTSAEGLEFHYGENGAFAVDYPEGSLIEGTFELDGKTLKMNAGEIAGDSIQVQKLTSQELVLGADGESLSMYPCS